jgi:hypothetical protein
LHIVPSSPMRATCPVHLILLDLPNNIWEWARIMKLLTVQLPSFSVPSSLFGPILYSKLSQGAKNKNKIPRSVTWAYSLSNTTGQPVLSN